MASNQNDQLVRRLEAELLDRNHLQFAILRRNQQTAISHLLKILGDFLRGFEIRKTGRSWSTLQTIAMTTIEASEHALRWVLLECKNGTQQPGDNWKQKDAEALDLLVWAIDYAQLYGDHTAWSRGIMSPLVDSETKTIAFEYPIKNTSVLMEQLESNYGSGDAFEESIPKSIDETIVWPWTQSLHKKHLHEWPILTIDRERVGYQDAMKWAAKIIFPEISGDRDLGGFTLDEFRQFYVSLWINCRCITEFECAMDRALNEEHLFGTRLLQESRENMIHWLSQFCAIPANAVKKIVEQLTFDPSQRHPSYAGHLFVPSADGTLTLLPILFARTDPNLMLSMSLSIGETRRFYESIIEEIEIAAKKHLTALFREHGYLVWDTPLLNRSGMASLTPDLVVGRDGDGLIAVIEYKHALPPRGAAAVSDRIKEASKWIAKAKRYLIAAREQSQSLHARLGFDGRERQIIVVIVPKWPMPALISIDAEGIYIRDVSRMQQAILQKASIAEIVGINSSALQPSMKCEYHNIRVGEWTYRHPILIPEMQVDSTRSM